MDKEETDALLFDAAKTGTVADVRAAIDAGADVNATTKWKESPLHFAADHGQSAVASLLIQKGADVNAKSKWHNTPLHLAAKLGEFTLANLLIKNGADVNVVNSDGDTPIDAAIKSSDRADIVELLTIAAKQQQGHAGRVAEKRKDKGPPQVGG